MNNFHLLALDIVMLKVVTTMFLVRHVLAVGLVVCSQATGMVVSPQVGFPSGGKTSHKILVSMTDPTSMKSRTGQMAAIAGALVARGHSVTLLAPSNRGTQGFEGGGVTAFNHSLIYDVAIEQSDIDDLKTKMIRSAMGLKDDIKQGSGSSPLWIINRYMEFFAMSCSSLFENPALMRRLREKNFDILLHIAINPCDFLVAESLGIPYITMTSSIRFVLFHEGTMSIPIPSSYVPFAVSSSLTDDMTFVQRLVNFVIANIVSPAMVHYSLAEFKTIQTKYNISREKTITELMGATSLWLAHTDFSLDFPRPTAPNWVPIGGVLVKDAKPLSEDLEQFLAGAGKHGVIVFSLGSGVTSLMDEDLNEIFAKVFSQLPQRVLWRFVGSTPRNLGNNTRLMSWLPQNDLLGHPQTRLLMYHGGINGVYEAIYHRVPMVLLPIFADQPAIGARVTKKGMGLVLDRTKLTHENVKGAIEEVINNPVFKQNVERIGAIHRDTMSSPLDTAVFWIEHVLKFGGDHLRLRGSDLSFFVHHSFDVIALAIVVGLVVLYVDFLILRTCYRCLCGRAGAGKKAKSD